MSGNASTDVMTALNGLQKSLDAGIVKLTPCDLHPELGILADEPNGRPRFTFALVEEGRVTSVAVFVVLTGHVEGYPCLHVGCAVIEARRHAGVGSRTLHDAIDELRNGLCRNNFGPFFLEATVPAADEGANKFARKLISSSPLSGTHGFGAEPILQYFRKIDCPVSDTGAPSG